MSDPQARGPAPSAFRLYASRGFEDWLRERTLSLAFTTYQAGKLFLLGTDPAGRLSVYERTFPRPMGLTVSPDGSRFWLAAQNQVHLFQNTLRGGLLHEGHDALFVPRASWVTGDLDIHDMALDATGRPLFVNTRFNCLARLEEGHSFAESWRPPFITALVAEDRCHLNGLAMQAGRPRFVTAISRSDVIDGWRDARIGGGIVVNVATNAIVAEGLSMPHSPRLVGDALWLLNSARGEFGRCDPRTGHFEPLVFCPGYARGLCIYQDRYALIGLSLPRDSLTFGDLPLAAELERRGAVARCGLLLVDLESGETLHWMRIEGVVTELYDVALLPRVTRPALVGFKGPEIDRIISVAPRGT